MAKQKGNVEDIFGLSPMQEGILFHAIHAPQSGLYVEQYACTVTGGLDRDHFEAAWAHVVARHGILRTLFTWEKRDRPLQVVRGAVTLPWRHEDWRNADPSDHDGRLHAMLRLDREAGFSLDRAPLMRFALFRTSDREHRFVWTFHHLLLDGWSMRLVLREVLNAYEQLVDGESLPTARPRPYRDFITWLHGRNTEDAERYWRSTLRGFDTPTPLAAACAGVHARWAERHDTVEVSLSTDDTRALTAAARDRRLTLNTFLRGAWALYLSRTSGTDDVVFGATVSGRTPDLEGVENMVGLFINSIPVRVRVTDEEPISTWLEGIQRDQLDASVHDTAPLADIQRWSDVRGEPLFQSLLVVENHPAGDSSPAPRLEISNADYVEQSNFPLAVLVVPGGTLDVIFVYDRDRFDSDSIQAMAGHFESVLTGLARNPDGRVGDVSLLSEQASRTVLEAWNDTATEVDGDRCIHHLIRSRAAETPDAVAVRFEGETLSYRELLARADALAGHLESLGAGPGRSVAIGVERSVEMIVAILGVLESGAAYVPFTPDQPPERTRLVLSDTDAVAVLSAGDHLERLRNVLPESDGSPPVVPIGGAYASTGSSNSPATPDDIAYIIYTSGSTGRPKGVEVTHRNLVHSTTARTVTYPEPVSAFCLLSPFVFDSSVAGIFWTLTTGGTLVLPSPRMEQDVPSLGRLLHEARVSHYLSLPVVHGLILEHAPPEHLTSLRTIVIAGESCPTDVVREHTWRMPHVPLYNEYGPTEASVWSTVHRITAEDADTGVPIGRPIPNVQVYILDPRFRPVPPGVPGELFVGGAGVARGYRNRPDETSERFVDVSLGGGPDTRLYRTGDRARYRADGVIEFLGRVDHQVKIRGHRIELGEVESHLRRGAGVRDAVVMVTENASRAALVAYVEADDGVTETSLRAQLGAALPEYMVPAAVLVLDAMPRTATGKIDRAALPAPENMPTSELGEGSAPPGTEDEARLAALWADVLGRDDVGVHDNFFELGGDSILSIRIIARAREAGFRISPQAFFDHPTVAGLAAVAAASADPAPSDSPAAAPGPVPLTPIQHWFFETVHADPHHWNLGARLGVPPGVDAAMLETALGAMIIHHDAFRLRFTQGADGWRQESITSTTPVARDLLTVVDVSGEADVAAAVDVAEAEVHGSLSLQTAPLLRAVLCRTPADQHDQLVLVIHHLVVDAVSWPIVVEDLATACEQVRIRQPVRLPTATTPFARWAEKQAARAESPEVAGARAYWSTCVPDDIPPLPRDGGADTENVWGDAATTTVSLDGEETDALLRDATSTYRMRVNEFLLSALALAFGEWTGSSRLLVDTEGHGRDHGFHDVDVTRTVGWFTTVFPILLHVPDGREPEACLIATKETVRAVPDHGSGYGLLRYMSADSSVRSALAGAPAAEVGFNYLGRRPGDQSPFKRPTSPSTGGGDFRWLQGATASARSPRAPRPYLLEIDAGVAEGTLTVDWTYNPRIHRAETVDALAASFVAHLRSLIAHCTTSAGAATPSDFPLADLDSGEFERLAGLLGDADETETSS